MYILLQKKIKILKKLSPLKDSNLRTFKSGTCSVDAVILDKRRDCVLQKLVKPAGALGADKRHPKNKTLNP